MRVGVSSSIKDDKRWTDKLWVERTIWTRGQTAAKGWKHCQDEIRSHWAAVGSRAADSLTVIQGGWAGLSGAGQDWAGQTNRQTAAKVDRFAYSDTASARQQTSHQSLTDSQVQFSQSSLVPWGIIRKGENNSEWTGRKGRQTGGHGQTDTPTAAQCAAGHKTRELSGYATSPQVENVHKLFFVHHKEIIDSILKFSSFLQVVVAR